MYLKASLTPKFDPMVQSIQLKLNAINIHVHGNWLHLQPDGKFGEKTASAVKAFQVYRNITPASGDVGNTTLNYINESYNHIPQLRACNGFTTSKASNADLNCLLNKLNGFVKDQVFGILNSIQREFDNQANNLKHFKNPRVSSTQLQLLVNKRLMGNPNIKALQNTIKDIWKHQDIIKALAPQTKGNTNAYNYRSRKDSIRLQDISRSQSVLAKSNVLIKNSENIAKQLYTKCMAEIEKANIAGKIDQMIKKGPKVTKGGTLRGGGILAVISLIPFISDVIIYFYCLLAGLPSEEAGKKVLKDLISLLEGAIIGAIVAAVVAAIGLTGGVAIVVIVVVCLIIGLIIALFCPEDTILEWIAKEINKTIHSSVFQEIARTSFV